MASALQVISDWMDTEEKEAYFGTHRSVVLRWLNEAQLRFAEKSLTLRTTWTPSVPSTGVIALPTDFIKVIKDRVKKSATDNVPLFEASYPEASLRSFSSLTHYSIYAGNFYVWSAQSCSPVVPYIKKPAAISLASLDTTSLEIPEEFSRTLLHFIDASWAKMKGDYAGYQALLKIFDTEAVNNGIAWIGRNEPIPKMRGGYL